MSSAGRRLHRCLERAARKPLESLCLRMQLQRFSEKKITSLPKSERTVVSAQRTHLNCLEHRSGAMRAGMALRVIGLKSLDVDMLRVQKMGALICPAWGNRLKKIRC
jgi:hypothetical protein